VSEVDREKLKKIKKESSIIIIVPVGLYKIVKQRSFGFKSCHFLSKLFCSFDHLFLQQLATTFTLIDLEMQLISVHLH